MKKYLSLLLSKFYSKKESALVAHQSFPDSTGHIELASGLSIGNWGLLYSYQAPKDGFLCVEFKKASGEIVGDLGIYSNQLAVVNGTTSSSNRGVFIPLRKGGYLEVMGANITSVTIRFISTVGAVACAGGGRLAFWLSAVCKEAAYA